MARKLLIVRLFFIFLCISSSHRSTGQDHEILFCGEKIPVSSGFVADKLMDVIKGQIRFVNMSNIKEESKKYFPIIEKYLRETNLPEDFKYLAIVESAFKNAVSKAGAAGFWQLMIPTAIEKGLVINGIVDERNDIKKATHAACKLLAEYYLSIHRNYGIYSWVLAAAAYNNGIGKITRVIRTQGTNYFEMKLNGETAAYVYKIIAVKELFEYPELYMKDFGYNVFTNKNPPGPTKREEKNEDDTAAFNSISVNVSDQKDSKHPAEINLSKTDKKTITQQVDEEQAPAKYVSGIIKGKYKDFQDGDLITIELQENLQVRNQFKKKGKTVKGPGWIIDDKVLIDLQYGRSLTVYDGNSKKGVFLSSLKNDVPVLLKVIDSDD